MECDRRPNSTSDPGTPICPMNHWGRRLSEIGQLTFAPGIALPPWYRSKVYPYHPFIFTKAPRHRGFIIHQLTFTVLLFLAPTSAAHIPACAGRRTAGRAAR